MILNENYGNLNMLDKSFLYYIDYDHKNGSYTRVYNNMNLKGSMISPNSKIEVNSVKPHSMKRLIEILDDWQVGFIIFRINKKQICLISTNKQLYNESMAERIILKPSVLFTNLGFNKNASPLFIDSEIELKKELNKIYKKYSEIYETTKKPVWDILVVYKDLSISDKWTQRDNAKRGYVPTPKEKNEYFKFILDYQNAWKNKCAQWMQTHRPDTQNSSEIKKILLRGSKINEFKFKGDIYELVNGNLTWLGMDDKEQFLIYANRKIENDKINGIAIKYRFKGLIPVILGIYGTTETVIPRNFDELYYKPLV